VLGVVQVAAPDREGLRRLAEVRLDRPVVLSLYLDLDPSQFAVPRARSTQVHSLLDEADRRIRDTAGLSHQDRLDLARSLDRARDFLQGQLDAGGAHGLALFACEPADLFETVKLPRSVASRVAIDRSPLVGPLAGLERHERWCVALVGRRDARIFRGSPDGLREREPLRDEVHGQHDQGGWSQARYQRSVEKEKDDHLRHVADVLLRHFKSEPFERLVLGGPKEVVADFESKLHPYVAERLAGRVEVDVETANADAVLGAARPLLEELEERRERVALDRLGDGKGVPPGRVAAGLDDVLGALNERRVEVLLLVERLSAPGGVCPRCGWLGAEGIARCPADDTPLDPRDDVVEPAVELALQQSADVLPIRRNDGELRSRGGIAALLRF
jgi:peptide chain release factor subunit 1